METEVRRSQDQIVAARVAGWLRIEIPDRQEVLAVEDRLGLDAGEAETIVLAVARGDHFPRMLVDERRAFRHLEEAIRGKTIAGEVVCLAQVLHHLEEMHRIPSAPEVMGTMLQNAYYAWAPNVRRSYEAWCRRYGKIPLP